jgi:hypothetical protein
MKKFNLLYNFCSTTFGGKNLSEKILIGKKLIENKRIKEANQYFLQLVDKYPLSKACRFYLGKTAEIEMENRNLLLPKEIKNTGFLDNRKNDKQEEIEIANEMFEYFQKNRELSEKIRSVNPVIILEKFDDIFSTAYKNQVNNKKN